MKNIIRKISTSAAIVMCVACISAHAQDARSLIKEATDLSNAKQYPAAIEKYKAALVVEPDNAQANYQLAFALNASGKGTDAIPYLQKVATDANASANLQQGAYTLLGSIYDQSKQPAKAVENYKKALSYSVDDQQLNYNLGLAYFRNHQYAEAETCARMSMKLMTEPHPERMRLYALVLFHQNKRAPALLALCDFLLQEPNTARSPESYSNIQHIFQGGELKPEPGVTIHTDAETDALNRAITTALADVAKRRYFVAADKFTEQLQAVFAAIGPLAKQQHGSDLFKVQAARFYSLSQSGNMPAFARLISQSSDKASAAWIAGHGSEMDKLAVWLKAN